MSSQMPSAVAWTLHASKVFPGVSGDLIWLIANEARCARIIPSLERPGSTFLMTRPASGPIAGGEDGVLGISDDRGLLSISEIFDGDPPHMPRGC